MGISWKGASGNLSDLIAWGEFSHSGDCGSPRWIDLRKSVPSGGDSDSILEEIMLTAASMKPIGTSITSRGWAFFALAVAMVFLLIPLPAPAEDDFFRENLQNLAHVPLFAIVTFLLRFLQLSSKLRRKSLFLSGIAAALLAVLSEIVQSLTGRTLAAGDLGADLCGILLAFAFLVGGSGGRVVIVRLVLLLAGGGMLVLAARPLAEGLQRAKAKRAAFPVLVDLGFQNGLWQAQGKTRLEVLDFGGGKGLEIRMPGGSYEGLRYAVPNGVDTSGYSGLSIETSNPGEAFELGVRMDDDRGRRRNGSVMVPQGRSDLRVKWAVGRGEGGLVRLVLFTGADQPPRSFRLLDARLVRGDS